MKALREAVEVGRRAQELAEVPTPGSAQRRRARPAPSAAEAGRRTLFEGRIRLEIGPLGDFSQLVGIEDAIGRLGAAEISVERFSEGRATLSMQPRRAGRAAARARRERAMEFSIRRTADDSLILDVDEDQGPGQRPPSRRPSVVPTGLPAHVFVAISS